MYTRKPSPRGFPSFFDKGVYREKENRKFDRFKKHNHNIISRNTCNVDYCKYKGG